MQTVGVIGATGFIGGRLVDSFQQDPSYCVRAIIRDPAKVQVFRDRGIECRLAEGTDERALSSALDGCDLVVHAAIGSPTFLRKTAVCAYRAATRKGVRRLVYLSTGCVHGLTPGPDVDEESVLSDRQPIAYNNAKVQAERALQKARSRGKTEVVILRPMIVWGVGDRRMRGIADSLINGTAYLINSGKGVCSTVYIDNLIACIRLAFETPGVDREAFLVGDNELVTWADLHRFLAEALGIDTKSIPSIEVPYVDASTFRVGWKRALMERLRSSDLLYWIASLIPARSRQLLKRRAKESLSSSPPTADSIPTVSTDEALLYLAQHRLSWTKAKRCLGYEPVVSFDEACRRTIDWLSSEGYPIQAASGAGHETSC